jgi:hypothetical protein
MPSVAEKVKQMAGFSCTIQKTWRFRGSYQTLLSLEECHKYYSAEINGIEADG